MWLLCAIVEACDAQRVVCKQVYFRRRVSVPTIKAERERYQLIVLPYFILSVQNTTVVSQWDFRCRQDIYMWINHLPPVRWSTFWKSSLK